MLHPSENLPPDAVVRELETILASKVFSSCGRISRFPRYVVEQTLQGGGGERLKEYQVGLDVFGPDGTCRPLRATPVAGRFGAPPSFLSAHKYLAEFYLSEKDYPGCRANCARPRCWSTTCCSPKWCRTGRTFQSSGASGMLEAMLKIEQKQFTAQPHNYELARTCILLEEKNKAVEYLNADSTSARQTCWA